MNRQLLTFSIVLSVAGSIAADDLANARRLVGESVRLGDGGKYLRAADARRQALELFQKLYPREKYPDRHPDISDSLDSLGVIFLADRNAEKALPPLQQALAMRQRFFPKAKHPDGHATLIASLLHIGEAMRELGHWPKALPFAEQSLAMARKLYPQVKFPDGHPQLAESMEQLGLLMLEMGEFEKARTLLEQALALWQRLYPASKYPQAHPSLIRAMHHLGCYYLRVGDTAKAHALLEKALELRKAQFPAGRFPDAHPDVIESVLAMAAAQRESGAAEKALPLVESALAMSQKLYDAADYPNGHPTLALAIEISGLVQMDLGKLVTARQFLEKSLAMNSKLFPDARFPDGHPATVRSMHHLGALLEKTGELEKASAYAQQALQIRQKLYPAPHFPNGHAQLFESLSLLGRLFNQMGQKERALPLLRQAEEMQRRLKGSINPTDEPKLSRTLPNTRDAQLSILLRTPNTEAESHRLVWQSKGSVTRILEQRLATARAAGTDFSSKLDRLKGLRRRTEQLLLDTRLSKEERDRLLSQIADERDMLERELAATVPVLQRERDLERLGPDDLAKALPANTVFVDFARFVAFENNPKQPNAPKRTPSYLAFVIANGAPTRRIELGPAEPIDAGIVAWRAAIEKRESSPVANELARKLWQPIAKHISEGTRTLYVAPDGELARLPWAALPGTKENAVLLEEFAGGIAHVPHGAFLLEQLKKPKVAAKEPDKILAVGGIDFAPSKYPALPGTEAELKSIKAAAGNRHITVLSGKEVTAKRLSEELPKARYVHIATVGEFDAEGLDKEKNRLAAAIKSGESVRVVSKNPLGFVRLVVSGGEQMTGLSFLDLPLEKTRLVTLSACDTALGEYTAGEGVQGLPRALHLAGCPNVIASLWKVNDAATAALMAKFYHDLWVNKMEPLAALRSAQLTIYHHPELIPELAGERDPPKPSRPIRPQAAKRSDTKLWAAFVLSGVGK